MTRTNTSFTEEDGNTHSMKTTHSRRAFLGGTAALGLSSQVGRARAAGGEKTSKDTADCQAEKEDDITFRKYIICIGYDFDTITIWLPEAQNKPTKLSRGIYGAEVGVFRILDLHDQLDLPATFFIPGLTIESFPEAAREVWDRGYDIQHHGWDHTAPTAFKNKQQEKAAIKRGIDSIEELTGRSPTGYRAPSWAPSRNTLEIIQELGFEWDSSQMARDFKPYYLRENWSAPPNKAFEPGEQTNMLEFPVSWERDDWPPLRSESSVVDEKEVFDQWHAQFDSMIENFEGGVFALTMHPQVIGHSPRIGYLKTLFKYMQSKSEVEFRTFDNVAKEIKINTNS